MLLMITLLQQMFLNNRQYIAKCPYLNMNCFYDAVIFSGKIF